MTRAATHRGSCLCGAVRYTVDGPLAYIVFCHCSRCRKGTGTAHGANLVSTRATLEWSAGADRVRTFRLPATRHMRSFCDACGSPLPSSQGDGALLVVPAGSLDTAVGIERATHILCADRAGWEETIADAPRLDGLPPTPG